MKTISISDARNHLPAIIDEVMSTHEQVVVLRHNAPTVAIIPFQGKKPGENRYPLRGHPLALAEDFDEPMPTLWDALAVAETPGPYGPGQGAYPDRSQRSDTQKPLAGTPEKHRKKG